MDPDGDVVIVLENPNAPFAVWDGAPAQDQDCMALKPVKFRVSSKHLQLASPVFKAALKGPWIEGTVTKRGCQEISTSDWDVEAFRIVLNVIHGCNRDVPHLITLEMLCKVAVLVDYYQCHEAFNFSSFVWVNSLRGSFSETYGRDLILWLCISCVFHDNTIFKAATKISIGESPENIRALGLPIPQRVIGTPFGRSVYVATYLTRPTEHINRQRINAVGFITLSLSGLKHDLISGSKGCTSECRYMFLGWLVTCMGKQKLDRNPQPFYGVSADAATKGIRCSASPRWNNYCCFEKLRLNAQSSIDKAMGHVHPLELKDYMFVPKDV